MSEWVRGLELDGIYPEGVWTKTIYFFAACEVLVATEGEFNDLTGEEHSAAFFFADALIGANKVYSDDAGYYQYWEEADPNTLDFVKQNKQMTKVLDELDDKFQALRLPWLYGSCRRWPTRTLSSGTSTSGSGYTR